ncbi:MAG: flagellar basal body P-ring protein FlgI [Brevinematia bacterium]
MLKKSLPLVLIILIFTSNIYSEKVKIKDISKIVGLDEIQVYGYGIVIGLKGTGDNPKNQTTAENIIKQLKELGVEVIQTNFQTRNIASVIVSGKISPLAKKGITFDVNVSSILDARSLEGGFLISAPLKDNQNNILAFASGSLITPKTGIKTTATIPNGGTLLSNLSSNLFEDNSIKLFFENSSPNTLNKVINALKEQMGNLNIKATDISTLEIEIPEEFKGKEVSFISQIMETEIDLEDEAVIVIDPRNNTLVITGDVRLYNVSIAYKGMKIELSELGGFFESGEIYKIPSNNLSEFISTLSKIGVKAEDLINIISLMKEAGAIKGKLLVK